jgi:hypothetical protein
MDFGSQADHAPAHRNAIRTMQMNEKLVANIASFEANDTMAVFAFSLRIVCGVPDDSG